MKNPITLAKRNLRFVMLESASTAALLSMSIMTPFFYSIGLSQLQISEAQVIFTIIMVFLNLPTGWIADRFSRKWANVIGDFGVALTFIAYALAGNFFTVVLCECSLGIFMTLSQGVDQSLLRHFCHKINPDEDFFRRKTAQLNCWHYVVMLILVWLGGPIGAISLRLAIALSGVPYIFGGIASLLVVDDSQRLITDKSPFSDMFRIIVSSFQNRPLSLRIFTYAVGREMTHAVIWVFTPLLLLAGVPLAIVSTAWALNACASLLGARLATKYYLKLKDWQIFAIPLALMSLSMGIIGIHLSAITIWFYLLMGVVQGWTGATLMPLVQRYARPEEQTSVISLTSIVGRLVYIPTSLLTGWVADSELAHAPLVVLLCFAPVGLFLVYHLLRE